MNAEDMEGRLAKLPRRAIVAFAARCARRVQSLTRIFPPQERDVFDLAIALAEDFANGSVGVAEAAPEATARAAEVTARAAEVTARFTAWAAEAGEVTWDTEAAAWAAKAAAEATARAVAGNAVEAASRAAEAAEAAGEAAGDDGAAALSDLNRLVALSSDSSDTLGEPIDPSEAGPLGPFWPQGAPWWLPKADVTRKVRAAAPIDVYFDVTEFGDEEIAETLGRLSDLYHALSGDVLVIEETGTLDPSRVLTPEGVE